LIIDLHTHTSPRSDDSKLELTELIHRARQAGLDAVCVTEHDWFWNKDDLARLSEKHNFLVLPGVETNTDDGHFLVFGLDKYTFGMHHTDFLRHLVDESGGAMILAHPYRRNLNREDDIGEAIERYCQRPFFGYVDIIETCNGRGSDRQNKFSRELCRRLNLKEAGGSDAHESSDLPSYATLFERDINNVPELVAELKAGRFKVIDLHHGRRKQIWDNDTGLY